LKKCYNYRVGFSHCRQILFFKPTKLILVQFLMSRRQKRKKAKNKTPKIKIVSEKEPIKRKFLERIKRFWGIVTVLGILMGLYLGFKPSISVKPNAIIENNGNAILTPFTISNSGRFSIYNVKCSCAPKYILSSNYVNIFSSDGDYASVITVSNRIAEKIDPGGEYTEYAPLAALANLGLSPTKADMAIIVSFRIIKFVPWEFRRKFRFITTKAKDGSFVWIQQPLKVTN
jgi:hypothetical protein